MFPHFCDLFFGGAMKSPFFDHFDRRVNKDHSDNKCPPHDQALAGLIGGHWYRGTVSGCLRGAGKMASSARRRVSCGGFRRNPFTGSRSGYSG